ncbi:DeoR/GlpR family DNA-binding transcription regulator [Pseudonocardia sp. GCM10023141]|uniref:DeoR/GlpR family DNA-binding transcription regulator n=1 Tax=Pseudonocardia sp. GCM10023141 TaxID=3252653 RepID=UPI00360B02AF
MTEEQPVFAEERRQRILTMLDAQGRVRIAELVTMMGVSEPTIRKDLTTLEEQKLLRRTHGGAIAVRPHFEPTIDDRFGLHGDAKDLISRACMEEIAEGDSVYLDGGTTVQRIAEHLEQQSVNVLTNAIGVATTLAEKPGIRHTLLGGSLRPLGGTIVGPVALYTLGRFTVNIAFISASGFTAEGISVADVADAQVKQAVIERARRVIVPIDSSKFGVNDFVTVCDLGPIDTVITERASAEIQALCALNSIKLRIVT